MANLGLGHRQASSLYPRPRQCHWALTTTSHKLVFGGGNFVMSGVKTMQDCNDMYCTTIWLFPFVWKIGWKWNLLLCQYYWSCAWLAVSVALHTIPRLWEWSKAGHNNATNVCNSPITTVSSGSHQRQAPDNQLHWGCVEWTWGSMNIWHRITLSDDDKLDVK